MKLCLISDTHMQHAAPEFPRRTARRQTDLELPKADILIHAGDFLGRGDALELYRFCHWLQEQAPKFDRVLIVAGNHDVIVERQPTEAREILERIPNVVYLQDSGVTIDGVRFWGSPWTTEYMGWAFNRKPGDEMDRAWELIPADTQVLITHSPPYGILDWGSLSKTHTGCERLAHRLGPEGNLKPKLHVFGHAHEWNGMVRKNGIIHANVSLCDVRGNLVEAPTEIELEFD